MSTSPYIIREVTKDQWILMGHYEKRVPNVIYRVHYDDGLALYAVSPTGAGAYYYSSLENAKHVIKQLTETENN